MPKLDTNTYKIFAIRCSKPPTSISILKKLISQHHAYVTSFVATSVWLLLLGLTSFVLNQKKIKMLEGKKGERKKKEEVFENVTGRALDYP